MTGVLKVLCPFCGNIGQHRMSAGVYKITCRNDECRRELCVGVRLLVPANSRNASAKARIPDDYVFPPADLGSWKPGERAHTLEDDTADAVHA
jgi:hypothetical protein